MTTGERAAHTSESSSVRDHTVEISWPVLPGPWTVEAGNGREVVSASLNAGDKLTLGSGRGAGLRVDDRAVSHLHCEIVSDERGLRVRDLGSKNGVLVGLARVRDALLPRAGGSFVVGRTSVCVRPGEGDDELPGGAALPGVVGRSVSMRRVARDVRRYARLRAPVLLQGETGTGKDLVARSLHDLGGREGPFLPLNVGSLVEALADAELFGHVRGAFTGAVATRAGAFEQAHAGTLFLDEVAELSPVVQVKLLRVVEDGQIRPLGGGPLVAVDVRIISASWADLTERVAAGTFREDLYHRLSTVVLELPPLRRRKSDLPELAEVLLRRYEAEFGPKRLSGAALGRLVAYGWPGNVRELGSVLYRAAAHSAGAEIGAEHLRLVATMKSGSGRMLSPVEAQDLLQTHGGNVSAAARAARVPRTTFRSWLEKAADV